MTEEDLKKCNETELLWLARHQGLGHLRKGLPKETLLALVLGTENPKPEHYSGTDFTRKKLEIFIEEHWAVVMSQLPGCNGKCTTYPCTEGRHLLCLEPNKEQVQ